MARFTVNQKAAIRRLGTRLRTVTLTVRSSVPVTCSERLEFHDASAACCISQDGAAAMEVSLFVLVIYRS